MIPARNVAEILGGRKILKREVRSLRDLNDLVQAGLPKAALSFFVARAANDKPGRDRLLQHVVARATLARRQRLLSRRESEKVERLARVVATANYVWDDAEEAREFLHRPHPMLGDRAPIDHAASELGAREVEDLLWRLYHGIAA